MKVTNTELLIAKSKSIHGDSFDYSNTIYTRSKTKVEIKCKKCGHIFMTLPNTHFKHGCKSCNAGCHGVLSNKKVFIEKSIKVHGNKYDYSMVEYINAKTKVKIICPEHGIFELTPDDHLNKKRKGVFCPSGCPKCSWEISAIKRRKSAFKFIEKANYIHNNKYDYSKIKYEQARKKVEIICPIEGHGSFLQTPDSHINAKCGCPVCGCFSKGENAIVNWLEAHHIKYEKQKRFDGCVSPKGNKLRYDFYFSDINTLLEYDGKYHNDIKDYAKMVNKNIDDIKEEFEMKRGLDKHKTKFASDNCLRLVRISYKEFSKINSILSNLFPECV